MNKRFILLALLLILLAACGPTTAGETAVPAATQPARPSPTSDPSLLNNNNNAPDGQGNATGYPVLPPTLPPATAPDSYPVPTPLPQPADAYPASNVPGAVWVLHAQGEQCVDPSTFKYPTEQDARAGLVAAGITVHSIETISMIVCQACNCPSGVHYRAQIDAADLAKAVALGWLEE